MKISIDELDAIVFSTYKEALEDLGFRPEQAFSYVLEETDYAIRRAGKPMSFVWQIMVYMHGLKCGLSFSEKSDNVDYLLDLLCESFSEIRREQLVGLGISEEQIEVIFNDAEIVRRNFLHGRC